GGRSPPPPLRRRAFGARHSRVPARVHRQRKQPGRKVPDAQRASRDQPHPRRRGLSRLRAAARATQRLLIGEGNLGCRLGGEFLIDRRFHAPMTSRTITKAAAATNPMAKGGIAIASAISATIAPPTAATMTLRMAGN